MKKFLILSFSIMVLTGCATTQQTTIKVEEEPILVGIPLNERIARSEKKINEQLGLLEKIRERKYVGSYNMVVHNNELDARKNSSRTLPEIYAKIDEIKAKQEKEKQEKIELAEKIKQNNELNAKENFNKTLSEISIKIDEIKAKQEKEKQEKIELAEKIKQNNELNAKENFNKTLSEISIKIDEIKAKQKKEKQAKIELAEKMQQKIKKIEWENGSANELAKHFAKSLGYELVISGNKDLNVSLKVENEPLVVAINKFENILKPEATILIVEQNKTFNIIYKK